MVTRRYIEIKDFIENCSNILEVEGIPIENISKIFVEHNEIFIIGFPHKNDHNCNVMGCNSVEHILCRREI